MTIVVANGVGNLQVFEEEPLSKTWQAGMVLWA